MGAVKVGIPQDFRNYLSLRGSSVTGNEAEAHQPLTLRALVVGTFLSFFLGVGANYADIAISGSYMTLDFSAPGAIFLFLVLVGLLNALFKFAARNAAVAFACFTAVTACCIYNYYPFTVLLPYSPGVLFSGFIVVALLANALLAMGGRNLALNRSELIVVYIMLLVVASLATMGLCETILPAITGAFYYVSPENK